MGFLHCLVPLTLYFAAAAASGGGEHWCYASQHCKNPECKEPHQWKLLFKECGNSQQSPINILTRKVKLDSSLTPFEFKNYNIKSSQNWVMQNNGHTVKVKLNGTATVEMGGLPCKYKAMELHFHWGNGGNGRVSPGSEHSIDGERYAMELHIVHIKEEFDTVASAIQGKGVAVMGYFIMVGKKNKNYEPLISKLNTVGSPDKLIEMPALPLDSLIPEKKDLARFYRYTGSLTTPGCNENVVWTLFEKPIELGLEQIHTFWDTLYFNSSQALSMVDNFRPIQPVGNRIIYTSNSNTLFLPGNIFLLVPITISLTFFSIH